MGTPQTPQMLQSIANTIGHLPELDSKDPIVKDTTHLSHETGRDPAGALLGAASLLASLAFMLLEGAMGALGQKVPHLAVNPVNYKNMPGITGTITVIGVTNHLLTGYMVHPIRWHAHLPPRPVAT